MTTTASKTLLLTLTVLGCAGRPAPMLESRATPNAVTSARVDSAATRSGSAPGMATAGRARLVVLHDNDLHFNFNHTEQWLGLVGSIRERYENTLLLNAGDLFVRYADRWEEPKSLPFYERRAHEVIAWMNRAGYDAAVAGNHELDHKGRLTGNALRSARFPVLGANILADGDTFPDLPPYTVLVTPDGLKVGVVGLSTVRNYTDQITALDPLRIMAGQQALRRAVDVLIVLSHMGFDQDKELARRFPFIDAIVGGHSHTELPLGHVEAGVLIVQSAGHQHRRDPVRAMSLGRIIFDLDNGRVVGKCAELLHIDSSAVKFVATPEVPWQLRDACLTSSANSGV